MPEVSIALTTYNGDAYLEELLDSILNQTRKPDEIIVCDDNSDDRTVDILEKYEEEYQDLFRIFVNDANLGVRKNFEKAVKKCEGDYIAIADQDDIWDEDKLERELEAISDNDCSLVFHDSRLLGGQGTFWEGLKESGVDVTQVLSQDNELKQLVQGNFVQGCTIVFDSDIVDSGFPDSIYYDHYLAIKACLEEGICCIEDTLLSYRVHDEQDMGPPRAESLFEDLVNSAFRDGEKYSDISNRASQIRFILNSYDIYEFDDVLTEREEFYRLRAKCYSSNFLGRIEYVKKSYLEGYYFSHANGVVSAFKDLLVPSLKRS